MPHSFQAVPREQYLTDMDTKYLLALKTRINSLSIFRDLLSDPVIESLQSYLDSIENGTCDAVKAYSEFVSRLYNLGCGKLGVYLQTIVNNSENVYVRLAGKGMSVGKCMPEALNQELSLFDDIAKISPSDMYAPINWDGFLPSFEYGDVKIAENYLKRLANIGKFGYGIYAAHRMFYLDENGSIVPVKNPDPTQLSSLVDYESQQKVIVDNTRALLSGKIASNILLTGDAGTGKSSTVKAVVNELYEEGLRIIEVRKDQLTKIPQMLDELAQNPLKFIIFIDDLSFTNSDDCFNALKAVLEGSVSSRSQNTVVYATSNRRHLVKESFSDRDGDDIHRNDTMQEIVSLSDRFGIHLTFDKPNKQTYFDIVHHLAKEHGVKLSAEELELEAERFALARGGRSARGARQLIENLAAQE